MTNTSSIGRRTALGLGLATGAAAIAPRRARAQAAKEVKIAMLVPLSGPWARQGILEQMGADMAIDDINNAGGIKALGGAKLRLMSYDTGDSRREGEERRTAHGRAGARSGRRLRLLAFQFHTRGHRGDRACRTAVADAELFRRDHRPRLQVRIPVLAHRGLAGRGAAADDRRTGAESVGEGADQGGVHRRQFRRSGQLHERDPRSCAEERETDVGRRRGVYAAAG